MVDVAPGVAAQADAASSPSTRRYYVLGLLTIIYALNFLDRTIFNVLIEPIKKEFTLSDTAMGLLAGFGFVLFYSLLGIPIARIADRLNRLGVEEKLLALFAELVASAPLAGAQHSVGHPVTVGIDQPVIGATLTVEVDQRPAGVLDAVEAEPAQVPATVHGHRPCSRSVVGEVAFRGAVVVEIEHGMVGQAIAVEVRQGVIGQSVAVEIQTDGIQPAVTV